MLVSRRPSSLRSGQLRCLDSFQTNLSNSRSGGEGEIRTRGGIATTPVFKTGALNRSATSPLLKVAASHCRRSPV
jgi:hypothetical protein